mgnify:CR=1 FL=1|jgi:hypothetical protein
MDRSVILRELEKVGRAIGVPLAESRLPQYVEDLCKLDETVFIEVCVEIRTSWEKLSFPPVGVFLNRARAKKSCGFEQNGPHKVVVQDHLVEAARRQEEYLKMSHDEYMAVCLELMRGRGL